MFHPLSVGVPDLPQSIHQWPHPIHPSHHHQHQDILQERHTDSKLQILLIIFRIKTLSGERVAIAGAQQPREVRLTQASLIIVTGMAYRV